MNPNLLETGSIQKEALYITMITHGVLLGAFGITFLLCAGSAVVAASCIQKDAFHYLRSLSKEIVLQSR